MYQEIIHRFLSRGNYISATPRAALIDMDGTLYDSMPYHALAWKQMTSEIGIDLPTDEFFRFEGRTGRSTIDIIFMRALGRHATEQEATDLYRRKTEIFASMPPVQPMPGAREMLEFLDEIGLKRVLVTGSGQNTLLNRLDDDFPGAFTPELRVTSRDVTHGKPDPEPYLKAMAMAEVSPNDAIVIENAPLGVESGYRSGAFTVGITTGPLKEEELAAAGADITFGSMPEFASKLPMLIYGLLTNRRNYN